MKKNPLKKELNLFYPVLLAAVLIVAGLLMPLVIIQVFDPDLIWLSPHLPIPQDLLLSLKI